MNTKIKQHQITPLQCHCTTHTLYQWLKGGPRAPKGLWQYAGLGDTADSSPTLIMHFFSVGHYFLLHLTLHLAMLMGQFLILHYKPTIELITIKDIPPSPCLRGLLLIWINSVRVFTALLHVQWSWRSVHGELKCYLEKSRRRQEFLQPRLPSKAEVYGWKLALPQQFLHAESLMFIKKKENKKNGLRH